MNIENELIQLEYLSGTLNGAQNIDIKCLRKRSIFLWQQLASGVQLYPPFNFLVAGLLIYFGFKFVKIAFKLIFWALGAAVAIGTVILISMFA